MRRGAVLAASNLLYREPDLHDHFADGGERFASVLSALVEDHGRAQARSVLDLGCGTGVHAEALSPRFDYTGVDVQPRLVDHARRARPYARFEVGDITIHRVRRRFDVVTCLGNTLAYLNADEELDAACSTLAAHVDPGGLVVIQTLVAPPRQGRTEQVIRLPRGEARVAVDTAWDPGAQIITTTRTWSLPDAGGCEQVTDVFVRRVHRLDVLQAALERVGLDLLETFDDPVRRGEPAVGPIAYVVGRGGAA